MSTREERLQTVEYDLKRFKTETTKAYGDMSMELVMVKGLVMDSVKRLMGMEKTLDEHTARFDRLETTLSEHTTVLQEQRTVLQEHTTVLQGHTTVLQEHTALLTQILARLPEKP